MWKSGRGVTGCRGGTWCVEWKPRERPGLKMLTHALSSVLGLPDQIPRQKPGCWWLMWAGIPGEAERAMREVRQRKGKETIQEVLTTYLCVSEWDSIHVGTSWEPVPEHTSEFLTEARTLGVFCSTGSHPSRAEGFLGYFLLPNSFLPDLWSQPMPDGRVPSGPKAPSFVSSMGHQQHGDPVAAEILQGRQMSHDWNTITICCGSFCPLVTEAEPLPSSSHLFQSLNASLSVPKRLEPPCLLLSHRLYLHWPWILVY